MFEDFDFTDFWYDADYSVELSGPGPRVADGSIVAQRIRSQLVKG